MIMKARSAGGPAPSFQPFADCHPPPPYNPELEHYLVFLSWPWLGKKRLTMRCFSNIRGLGSRTSPIFRMSPGHCFLHGFCKDVEEWSKQRLIFSERTPSVWIWFVLYLESYCNEVGAVFQMFECRTLKGQDQVHPLPPSPTQTGL